MAYKKQRRGAYRREDCTFIGTWVPKAWVLKIDELIATEDTDRSKIVRRAIEKKLKETPQ